jgi:hypothetical protein
LHIFSAYRACPVKYLLKGILIGMKSLAHLFHRLGERLSTFFACLRTPNNPINPVEIRDNIGTLWLNSLNAVLPI